MARLVAFVTFALMLSVSHTYAQHIGTRYNGPGEPPCPAGNNIEPWCEPGEAVVGDYVGMGGGPHVSIDNPPCDARMNPLFEKALRAVADYYTGSTATSTGLFDAT